MADEKKGVQSLRPKILATPQCCVPAGRDRSHRDRGYKGTYVKTKYDDEDPTKCKRRSVVMIDGKPYCATHGGEIALQKLIDGDM